ncbi:morphogenic membrane protein MmpB [Streptomyces albidoflavus]
MLWSDSVEREEEVGRAAREAHAMLRRAWVLLAVATVVVMCVLGLR